MMDVTQKNNLLKEYSLKFDLMNDYVIKIGNIAKIVNNESENNYISNNYQSS